MKKVYAVWEGKRTCKYITPNKKYEVLVGGDTCFHILDDDGDDVPCLWKNCAHLDGGTWTRIEEDDEAPQTEQKTLRDEFALSWLLGYMSNPETKDRTCEQNAKIAYKMADAMLEARKK